MDDILAATPRPQVDVVAAASRPVAAFLFRRRRYTIERMAADVAAVADDVGWANARVHGVGHSMGGMIAMAYASTWPERARFRAARANRDRVDAAAATRRVRHGRTTL